MSLNLALYKESVTKDCCYEVDVEFYIPNCRSNFPMNTKSRSYTFKLLKGSTFPELSKMDNLKWANFLPKTDLEKNFSNFYISENGDFSIVCKINKKFFNFNNQISQIKTIKGIECFNCHKFDSVLNNEMFSDVEISVETKGR